MSLSRSVMYWAVMFDYGVFWSFSLLGFIAMMLRMLRRARAYAKTRLSLSYYHTQPMNKDKGDKAQTIM